MDVATLSTSTRAKRRELGSYYTPRFIVQRMLHDCLQPWLRDSSSSTHRPFRILDPACGDGAFLLEAFDLLLEQSHIQSSRPGDRGAPSGSPGTRDRLQIVREHLFGVDVNSTAIRTLRKRLFQRIRPVAFLEKETRRILQSNIRCGNALTGPDFSKENRAETLSNGLNWKTSFSQVTKTGGFDLVIGNPPYRREKDAGELFEQVAATPLGRKWRQARMDYWYYFLHRGLDLLREHGRLSFIVNSYWTASAGAAKMIQRLERETTLEEILLLGESPIFLDVAGRHMIFRLKKGRGDSHCRVIDYSSDNSRRLREPRQSPSPLVGEGWGGGAVHEIPQQDLYQNSRLSFSRPERTLSQLQSSTTLGELYEVRQGMAENPPCIGRRHARDFGDRYQLGEEVFVLTEEKIESLNFSPQERALLRPYYQTSTVRRFSLPKEPTRFILYLTKETALTLKELPQIKRHLARFRLVLERRRETKNGTVPWWCLHWPREERIFTESRILCVQMGKVPQFVSVERPTFVGFSVNLILQKSAESFSLKTLTGILNSTIAFRWFERHAKHRGVNLEINGNHLKQFPLPQRNSRLEREIESLATEQQADAECGDDDQKRDQVLDSLVYRLYGVCLRTADFH